MMLPFYISCCEELFLIFSHPLRTKYNIVFKTPAIMAEAIVIIIIADIVGTGFIFINLFKNYRVLFPLQVKYHRRSSLLFLRPVPTVHIDKQYRQAISPDIRIYWQFYLRFQPS